MRILITGSRGWEDWQTIAKAMADEILAAGASKEDTIIVHGACPKGADKLADIIAKRWEANIESHPADWNTHGKAAGFIRNSHMVNLGADVCLAFIKDGSNGATHTANEAQKAGIRTVIHRQ